jgi:hypothetical protein
VYSLGKAKITGIASVWGVVGLNNQRSEANTDEVTGVDQKQVYLYFILSHSIIRLKNKVTVLDRIIGQELRQMPYINHKNRPLINVTSIR